MNFQALSGLPPEYLWLTSLIISAALTLILCARISFLGAGLIGAVLLGVFSVMGMFPIYIYALVAIALITSYALARRGG
jgi:hypothetical protein